MKRFDVITAIERVTTRGSGRLKIIHFIYLPTDDREEE
jgi:hypothetical protein